MPCYSQLCIGTDNWSPSSSVLRCLLHLPPVVRETRRPHFILELPPPSVLRSPSSSVALCCSLQSLLGNAVTTLSEHVTVTYHRRLIWLTVLLLRKWYNLIRKTLILLLSFFITHLSYLMGRTILWFCNILSHILKRCCVTGVEKDRSSSHHWNCGKWIYDQGCAVLMFCGALDSRV